MTCVHIPALQAILNVDSSGLGYEGRLVLTVDGRHFIFEWSAMWGPLMVAIDGEATEELPGERSPFWKALGLWIDQGHRRQGAQCLWDPPPPPPELVPLLSGGFAEAGSDLATKHGCRVLLIVTPFSAFTEAEQGGWLDVGTKRRRAVAEWVVSVGGIWKQRQRPKQKQDVFELRAPIGVEIPAGILAMTEQAPDLPSKAAPRLTGI